MTIKAGDKLPAGKLWELPVEWFAGCPTAAHQLAGACEKRRCQSERVQAPERSTDRFRSTPPLQGGEREAPA